MTLLVIGITAVLGLYMAWTIGANDVANSMGDAVGSKSISLRNALILAAIFEFCGSTLVGSHVTDTVRQGIVDPNALSSAPAVLALGMACALLGSALWLHLATWWGMPVSTTHSIVGAVAGFGVVAAGWRAVKWGMLGQIVASWFISPVAGAVAAFLGFRLIVWLILGRERPADSAIRVWPYIVFIVALVVTISTLCDKALTERVPALKDCLSGRRALILSLFISGLCGLGARLFIARHFRDYDGVSLHEQLSRVERVFAPLVVVTSCSVSFAHGANDVANAIGPLAAVVDIVRGGGQIKMQVLVPMWILVLGGCGIVLGLATYGHKVIATVGDKITQLTPSRGVAANIATATTVLVCSRMKLPISTSHTIVGAILGVGLARGLAAVNRNVTKSIFGSWLISVPASATLTILLFLLCRLVHLDEVLRNIIVPAALR